MSKYADDTYLIIPAKNIHSCSSELGNIDNWASNNNLQLNRAKSTEIVFVKPRSRGSLFDPPSVISGFTRVQSIKILAVTFSRKFSVSQHVNELLATCSQSLFALQTLPTTWTAGRRSTCSVPGDSHQQTELRFSSLVGICLCRQSSSLRSVSTPIDKTGLQIQQFGNFYQHL